MKNLLTTVEELLLDQEFFTGYGQSAVDINTGIPLSYSDILNYIDNELIYLYEDGLNYYISGGELIVSNSTCYDDFTNKRLIIKIGLDVQINCG